MKTSKFVQAGMREKGINNMERVDKEKWRRKIKLGIESYINIEILYINKMYLYIYIYIYSLGLDLIKKVDINRLDGA